MTAGPFEGSRWIVRVEPQDLQTEIQPLAEVHGVEIVAIEWLQGPGRGVLRLYIDRPGGDPRTAAVPGYEGATAELCARVSRDVAAALDALDLIPGAYDLEVSSPGFERPLQKRSDYDRFAGLMAKVKTRSAVGGRLSFEGRLLGTKDLPGGNFAVRVAVREGEVEIPASLVTRARLVEIKAPPAPKPGKGPGKNKRKSADTPPGAAPDGPAATTTETESEAGPLRERHTAGEAER